MADEGPAVALRLFFCLCLYVVIPSEALLADEGPAVALALRSFCSAYSVSRAARPLLSCHPVYPDGGRERGRFLADEGPAAVRFALARNIYARDLCFFKAIREQFPGFGGSFARPNELLLDAPEAMLYINLSRAILGFIESKTRT